jgi:hypothetical protein
MKRTELKRTGFKRAELGRDHVVPPRRPPTSPGRTPRKVDEALIVHKYLSGRSQQSVCREFGINSTRLGKIFTAHGVKPRKPGRPKLGTTKTSENNGREVVRLRVGDGGCEVRIDMVCTGAAQEWHHRRNRTQGGTWDASNGLKACSRCHHAITTAASRYTEFAANGWIVRSKENWATKRVLYRGRWALLDDTGDVHYEPIKEAS